MNKIEAISNIALRLKDMPLFVLPFSEQFKIAHDLSAIFMEVERELNDSGASSTSTFAKIKEINSQLVISPLNEYRIFSAIKDLIFVFQSQGDLTPAEKSLLELTDQVLVRAKDFWISEASLSKLALSQDEIKKLTRNLLEKEMQLYSLDYFLHMNKAIQVSNNKADIILHGIDALPDLISDAVADDMLSRIVYNIKDKAVRYRMISDYYHYKAVFLPLKGKTSLTVEEINKVTIALHLYCLSLLDILEENGISKIINGLSFPYGSGVTIAEVRKQMGAK